MTGEKWNIKLLPQSFSPWVPEKSPERQIAVLMSGGVDSSVTAHILKEAGWEVLGITMKIPLKYTDRKLIPVSHENGPQQTHGHVYVERLSAYQRRNGHH